MDRTVMTFLVSVQVDVDHEGVPEAEEIVQQLESAIIPHKLEDATDEFGIVGCVVDYLGERED